MPQKLNDIKELMIVLRKFLKKLQSGEKTITLIMNLLCVTTKPNLLSPLTLLHLPSFLPFSSLVNLNPFFIFPFSLPSNHSPYLPSIPVPLHASSLPVFLLIILLTSLLPTCFPFPTFLLSVTSLSSPSFPHHLPFFPLYLSSILPFLSPSSRSSLSELHSPSFPIILYTSPPCHPVFLLISVCPIFFIFSFLIISSPSLFLSLLYISLPPPAPSFLSSVPSLSSPTMLLSIPTTSLPLPLCSLLCALHHTPNTASSLYLFHSLCFSSFTLLSFLQLNESQTDAKQSKNIFPNSSQQIITPANRKCVNLFCIFIERHYQLLQWASENFRNIPLSQNHVKENNTLMVRVSTASL